jgi:osmotically-inducible protein OsmY
MKRTITVICVVLIASVVSFAQAAQPAQGGEMMKKSEKKAEKKAEKKKDAAPKTDADIQKCIADKFAASEKLKPQDFQATVSGGAATLTGNAANAGSKGSATRIAKSCGTSSVTNNITAPPVAKSKKDEKKADKKEEKKG